MQSTLSIILIYFAEVPDTGPPMVRVGQLLPRPPLVRGGGSEGHPDQPSSSCEVTPHDRTQYDRSGKIM